MPMQALPMTSAASWLRAFERTCRYWEIDREGQCALNKRPYRIELVGVTCDAGLAVARGVWRKLRSAFPLTACCED